MASADPSHRGRKLVANRGTLLVPGALLCSALALPPGARADESLGWHGRLPTERLARPAAQAVPTAPPPITIDFADDRAGSKPAGFASVASPAVAFGDTAGAGLQLGDYGAQGRGHALGTLTREGTLRIVLARPSTRIALAFGNDDPGFTDPGDEAVLTLFRGAVAVGQVRVPLNRNDVMDQTIAYGPQALFDRAEFAFDLARPGGGVVELIDDVVVSPLCTVAGTEGPDRLYGTAGPDVVCGGGGDDVISARGGDDTVYAGLGDDTVEAGAGADVVQGGPGDDALSAGPGDDLLLGNEGRDRCDGGTGADTARACEARAGVP